jgi:hypothetical protein
MMMQNIPMMAVLHEIADSRMNFSIRRDGEEEDGMIHLSFEKPMTEEYFAALRQYTRRPLDARCGRCPHQPLEWLNHPAPPPPPPPPSRKKKQKC